MADPVQQSTQAHIQGCKVILPSGRSIYANDGIVGLSPEMEVSQGYDGLVAWPPIDDDEQDALTADDMRAIADLMIVQWTRFRESLAVSEHKATQALRLKPLSWSDPQPPNTECRYDHATADTLVGRYLIDWKSWKPHDDYVLRFRDDYIACFDSLDAAKDGAAQHLAGLVAGVLESDGNG